jgi:hypothetical protein
MKIRYPCCTSLGLWRVAAFWSCILAAVALTGCWHPNFMTGGATDQDYIAGFDLAIDRERRGLTPPSQEPTTWASYWCQIIRSVDSPPPSAQKRRLKRYLLEKRRAAGLAELNC